MRTYSTLQKPQQKWKLSDNDCYEMNIDAAISVLERRIGIGVVFQDSKGNVMAALVNKFSWTIFFQGS